MEVSTNIFACLSRQVEKKKDKSDVVSKNNNKTPLG